MFEIYLKYDDLPQVRVVETQDVRVAIVRKNLSRRWYYESD